MPDQASFHDEFIRAMNGGEERLEKFLVDPTHMARARVYRNNSITANADAIFKNFPTVERLVGAEFLRATAIAYVDSHMPTSPVLVLYGREFADFLESFPPVAHLPYLADVARLDRAWTDAMFAANAVPMTPQDLAELDEAEMNALAPGLHPSVHVLESEWPAWDIWRANREDAPTGEQAMSIQPGWSGAVIWWSDQGATNWQLARGEAIFLQSIAKGENFGEALEKGSFHADPAKLFKFFSEALSARIFAHPISSSEGSKS